MTDWADLDLSFYKSLLDRMFDGVYFVDRDRRLLFWNDGAERISGFQSAEVIGRRCYDSILMHTNEAGDLLCFNGCPLAQTILDGQVREVQVFLRHKHGARVPVVVRAAPVRNAKGEIIGAVETFSDNSLLAAAIQQMEKLQQENLMDPLTGIGNRRHTEIKIDSSLVEMRRLGTSCALLFIDIDHFKRVNDQHGHSVGDRVLQMVADTLRLNLRAADYLGRWGGEEFLVVLEYIDAEGMVRIGEKLRRLVSQAQWDLADGNVQVTISIGATLARTDDTLESWVARADRLLYASKHAGRNRLSCG
ncbi:MAG TPA: sensor domain-containing diguanylate cyclase [Anaerolineaceae bacterium]|nr:sensor domain-containing diguanylate cyclase [Anaerolineaceae bacterium]